MNTVATPVALSQQMAPRLRQRVAELRALLDAPAHGPAPEHAGEVVDFKDVAAEDTRAHLDEVASAQATAELGQALSALRRIAEGSYGLCQDCGEAILVERLQALPATAYCTDCQSARERAFPRLG